MKIVNVEQFGHFWNPLLDLLNVDLCVIVDGWSLLRDVDLFSFTFDNSSIDILCVCLAGGLGLGGLGFSGGFGFGWLLATGVDCFGLGAWAASVGCK